MRLVDPDGVIYTLTPEMLEGSVLGRVLDGLPEEVYVAPKIGVDFVKPWQLFRSEEEDVD